MRPSPSSLKMFQSTLLPQRGFTLIEMIVSMSIFITTMLIVVGALLSLQAESRKARVARAIADNLGAAIDSMSRDIRMGTSYHCGCGTTGSVVTVGDTGFPSQMRDCPLLAGTGDVCFAYEREGGDSAISTDQVVYRLNNNRIERSKDGGQNTSTSWMPLTAPEIRISSLRFFVDGNTVVAGQRYQPAVLMTIQGSAGSGKTATKFRVQTLVDQRIPNLSIFVP